MSRYAIALRAASALIPLALLANAAHAQSPAAPSADAASEPAAPAATPSTVAPATDNDIVITGQRLEAARSLIQPSLGATDYAISNATIQALPGGDNQQLNQILLQVPGVVQDGFGQFHVRDDHNNLQYRINGIILPEGLAVFGQTLSPRLVEKFDLLTGALPAQYGLRTAGIVDITTKSGMIHNGGQVSIYGGSNAMIEPSAEYGGSRGGTNFYLSGDYRHNDVGIESVDGSRHPIHDKSDQYHAFAYLDHIIDAENRISFLGGYADQKFQIPNPRGLHSNGIFSVGGRTDFLSDNLDERQRERTAFGLTSFLHSAGPLSLQASLFVRQSSLDYHPDVLGELLFNGVAQRAAKRDLNMGAQLEGAYKVSESHTLRAGAIVSRDRGTSNTTTKVFPLDANGDQAGEPFGIADNSAATEWTYSVYLQDEWRILPRLTLNLGVRFDAYRGYRSERQLSPRANLVWTPGTGTTFHLGYARYFSPPPFANIATPTVAKFVGTSAESPGLQSTTPFAERQDYFDAGIQQKMGGFTIGIDAYDRKSRNLIDEGQFGAPIILTPFNYRDGRIRGIEGNLSYARGPWLAYANLAHAKAQGRNIVSSEFNFDPADLATIRNHYIYLDHDQTWTGSAGIAYRFVGGALEGTRFGADLIYGSGLRTTPDLGPPNGAHLPGYTQVNASLSHRFAALGLEIRFDVVNLFDKVYKIRDGSGVGVGAPQYGPRRGIFAGVTKTF
ncbi:MAG: TonB-dependent receptor [Alphaproteobacteria bacterium]|nr:TonB-dependent receptor [Alphaproteobacteria bacterium]